LLDTNVVSNALSPSPSPGVAQWLSRRFAECAISSVTIFELRISVALLSTGRRRETFENAIARMVRRFGPRVYAFDATAAEAAVRLAERARARGLGLHKVPEKLADLQIAGIADAYGLELATRNVSDFRGLGLSVVNPWESPAD
jgi:predicted nucleic acid-binding protein